MKTICWSLWLPVELNKSHVRSTEVLALTSKNTLRILNTIKPVTRAFTTMDAAKPVRISVSPQGATKLSSSSIIVAPNDASQVARGDKSKSAYQTKIDLVTYVRDCQEWRNDYDMDVFIPHDPTTADLRRLRWIKQMIGEQWFMRTNVHWAMKSQQPNTAVRTIETRNSIDCESNWSWIGSVISYSIRICITDKKNDILTDRTVTYLNYIY